MKKKVKTYARQGISTVIFATTAAILVVLAGIGFGLYFTQSGSMVSARSAGSSDIQSITSLAFEHWGAIGEGNLSATLSQYSSSAELWWYVQGSPLNTTSGPYTGSSVSSTWQKFFNNVGGPTYWTVHDFSTSFPSSGAAKVTADVWFVIGSGSNTHTLVLPYELDYNLQGGSWILTGDWWGLPHSPGQVLSGVVVPSSSSSTTSSSGSSSSTTTAVGGYGY
jgi:hypothetical protein